MNIPKKAALMGRVSSDEQAKGYSLDVQIDALTGYCVRNKYEIVYSFKEDHSAKSFERPAFNEFLKFAKANKGKIDVLLFTSWDRFSRNTADAYEMLGVLRRLGIEPQAIEQPIDLSIPENKAMLAFYLAIPEIENDRRSIKVIGGLRGAMKEGRWVGAIPKGYNRIRDTNGKTKMIPNDEAKVIYRIFRWIDEGFNQMECIRMAREQYDFFTSKTMMAIMLRNPLYIGKIFIPANDVEPDQFVDAKHEAIVPEDLFYRVQEKLELVRQQTNRVKAHKRQESLPLRGIFQCNNCGNNVTGSASRSRNGMRHFYYHCNHCNKLRMRANDANELVEQVLEKMEITEDAEKVFEKIMRKYLNGGLSERNRKKDMLTQKIEETDKRIKTLEEHFLDSKISLEEFRSMKDSLDKDKRKMASELNSLFEQKDQIDKKIKDAIQLGKGLKSFYNSLDVNGKAKLLGSIFPEKLQIENGQCRTTIINPALLLVLRNTKCFEKKKAGHLSEILQMSRRVASTGIEPVSKV